METYLSDKEQLEIIKNWWRENGKFTIISVITVLLLTGGWRYWQNRKNQEAASASIAYEQMLNHEANNQLSEVEFDATSLQTNHPHTPYASLAAFISAQNAINNNKFTDALEKFDWVIKNAKSPDFKQIARVRKARLLLQMKNTDEALNVLATINSKVYLPLINEVKGDIYLAKDDKKTAKQFYQNALHSLPNDAPHRSFLQMKLDEVSS